MPQKMRECLTFNDVLLVPAYSEILPSQVRVKTRLTRKISLIYFLLRTFKLG